MINTDPDFSEHLTSHNQIWRILLGFLVVLVIYVVSLFAIFFGLTYLGFNADFIVAGSSPENLTIVLLSFFRYCLALP